MKKKIFSIFLLLSLFIGAFAQKDNTLAKGFVRYWVGMDTTSKNLSKLDSNKVVMAINWANPDTALAWGYAFSSDSVSLSEVIARISDKDSRLTITSENGKITDVAYEEESTKLTSSDKGWAVNVNGITIYNNNYEDVYVKPKDNIKIGDIAAATMEQPVAEETTDSTKTDTLTVAQAPNYVWTTPIHAVTAYQTWIQANFVWIIFGIVIIVVIIFLVYYLKKAKEHPKGLVAAALSNMGERFGYYIMNAVLLLFIVSKFGIPDGTAAIIYSVFYFGIYVLSLVGGIIADRTQNYNRTIQWGLIIMAIGYVALSIPLFSHDPSTGFITDKDGTWWAILIFTCAALLFIAFGNGLFKGNLQALVGQMYDNFEAEAAKKGPEALAEAKDKRDSGFQIFYVFINIGGVIAPFIAPLLREWWLKAHDFIYNSDMSALGHRFLNNTLEYTDKDGKLIDLTEKFTETSQNVVMDPSQLADQTQFCSDYIEVFNQGIHFSFIASVAAMFLSLIIFLVNKKGFPQPAKKEAAQVVEYTAEEKASMAKEIKQRMYALFAVLGIAVFFWLSFHQNGQSLSVFARDFVNSDQIAPEIWQALNPMFVIILTPIIMILFATLARRGKPVSTPRKIALGMGIAGCAYLFLMVYSIISNYPSGDEFRALNAGQMMQMGLAKAAPWVMIVTYFFLTVAELFISPLGLSFVSKVAPRHMVGLCQGLWLGATAIGNLFIFVGPIMLNAWPIWICWGVFLAICLVSMIVMFSMVKWLERVTQ